MPRRMSPALMLPRFRLTSDQFDQLMGHDDTRALENDAESSIYGHWLGESYPFQLNLG